MLNKHPHICTQDLHNHIKALDKSFGPYSGFNHDRMRQTMASIVNPRAQRPVINFDNMGILADIPH